MSQIGQSNEARIRAPRGLPALYRLISLYGLGVGLPGVLIGLFVGWPMALAGVAHVLLGVVFGTTALGIERECRAAYTVGSLCALVVAATAAVVVAVSIHDEAFVFATISGLVLVFFLLVAIATHPASQGSRAG